MTTETPAREPLPTHWVDVRATAPGARFEVPTGLGKGWLRDAMAIAEVLFETEDGPPSPTELAWLACELDDHARRSGPRTAFVLRASVLALATFAPLAARRPVPLARLPLRARTAALARLERSPLSLNVLAVKAALCILWYEHPDHARRAGLTPGRTVRSS